MNTHQPRKCCEKCEDWDNDGGRQCADPNCPCHHPGKGVRTGLHQSGLEVADTLEWAEKAADKIPGKEKCKHKTALRKSGITPPEGYICRTCHPSSQEPQGKTPDHIAKANGGFKYQYLQEPQPIEEGPTDDEIRYAVSLLRKGELTQEFKKWLAQHDEKLLSSDRERVRAAISGATIAEDKVGSFKDGYECMKEQVLFLLTTPQQ